VSSEEKKDIWCTVIFLTQTPRSQPAIQVRGLGSLLKAATLSASRPTFSSQKSSSKKTSSLLFPSSHYSSTLEASKALETSQSNSSTRKLLENRHELSGFVNVYVWLAAVDQLHQHPQSGSKSPHRRVYFSAHLLILKHLHG
jgi:hypothetical protein